MKQILMGGFSGILGTGQVEHRKMMKGKLIDGKKIVSRFRSKVVKMIKSAGSKFDDYSVSPNIRQILLHWDYELLEKDYFIEKNLCMKKAIISLADKKFCKKQKKDILKKKLLSITYKTKRR